MMLINSAWVWFKCALSGIGLLDFGSWELGAERWGLGGGDGDIDIVELGSTCIMMGLEIEMRPRSDNHRDGAP